MTLLSIHDDGEIENLVALGFHPLPFLLLFRDDSIRVVQWQPTHACDLEASKETQLRVVVAMGHFILISWLIIESINKVSSQVVTIDF